MASPYETMPISGLAVPGGETRVFPIAFPNRSKIVKVVVVQTKGDAVDFEVVLFNAYAAAIGVSQSDSEGEHHGTLPPDLYRITPILEGEAGFMRFFTEGGYLFFSQEKGEYSQQRGDGTNIFVQLTAQGSGPKEFAIVIGGELST